MALFMAPVYGVDAGHLAFEFTKTRGVIHFHEMLCLIHNMMEPISEAMKVTFVGVSEAVKHLDEYIDAHWTVPPPDNHETDPLLFPISTLAEALETEWIKLDMHQDEHSRVAAADLEKSGGLFLGLTLTLTLTLTC